MHRLGSSFFSALTAVSLLLMAIPTLPAQDLLSNFQPREIGPTVFGGRIVDIEADVDFPHRIFVASASGGLWLTENNGTTWTNIFDNQPTISIGDIAVDPRDSKIVWVGTGEANNQRSSLWGNGVYRTTDRGQTWTHLGLDDTHHIGRIVVDPRNSDTAYVAALGHLYSSNEERGLFKTTDGGKSWEKILFVNEHVGVVDVIIDPRNPDILYAATYERLRRAWNFDGAGPGSAIYKTNDAGKSWKKLTNGLPSGEIGRIGLALFPEKPEIIYATVSNQNLAEPQPPKQSGDSTAEANQQDDSKSDSPSDTETASDLIPTPLGFSLQQDDQGFVVRQLPRNHPARRSGLDNGARITALGGIPATEPEKLIALVRQLKRTDQVSLVAKVGDRQIDIYVSAPPESTPRQIGGEVYRSDDGGESWKKVNRQPVGGTPAYYYGQIRVDPQDANRLYLLSVPLYTSTDGGQTWSSIARSVHVDHHALWINPRSPNHVMLGNDGGFHQSYDHGRTMDHYFNLPLAQFYAITVDMQQPYHVYGGTQDNGSWGGPSQTRTDGRGRGISPLQWYRIGGGDGFYVQVDPADSDFYIAESQFGAIFKVNRSTGESKSIRPRPEDSQERYRFNWNSPILMSRYDSRIIYFGGNKLFKSYNQGDDWQVISDDLTTADPAKIAGNVPHCTITTIAESPRNRQLLMVGTDDGKVHVTQDGGQNWTDLSGKFPVRPEEWWCSRVELSHHDNRTAYVSFTGYREDDFRCFLFRTTDLGETWTSIQGDLPAEPVNVIKEDRHNPGLLYVGTEFGGYATLDGGVHWNRLPGIPRVAVHDLIVHPRDNDLVLGTHGRGFFIIDDITPLQQMHRKTDAPVQLFEPRPVVTHAAEPAVQLSGDREFTGTDPRQAGKVWYRVHNKSDVPFKITVVDESGKQVYSEAIQQEAGLHFIAVSRSPAGGRQRGRSPRRETDEQKAPAMIHVPQPGRYTVTLEGGDAPSPQSVKLIVE